MYSFTPLDAEPYYGILFFALSLWFCVGLMFSPIFDKFKTTIAVIAGGLVVITVAFLLLFDKPKEPANIPVRATLMHNDYVLTEKAGKHSTSDNRYLMYMTPDGPVSFRRYDGKVYPKEAILYKN